MRHEKERWFSCMQGGKKEKKNTNVENDDKISLLQNWKRKKKVINNCDKR